MNSTPGGRPFAGRPEPDPPPSRSGRAIAGVIALLLALGLVVNVAINDDDGNGKPDRVTIELRGAQEAPPIPGQAKPPERMELGEDALEARDDVAESKADGHAGERNEDPDDGIPPSGERAILEQQRRLADTEKLPDVTPLAAPSQAGCRTRLVGNYSSRNGVRPRIFVMHYTVSRNRPGFADVDGITAYFNNPGAQASSNYVVDADGNCNYIVRETSKSWTQARLNPVSISVESIAYGDERDLANPAGYAKVARIYRDAARRWGIPLQRGIVRNGVVVRAGLVDHRDLGPAGGGHHDVSPFDERNRAVNRVLALAKAGGAPAPPRKVRAWCAGVERFRADVRAGRKPGTGARRLAVARKRLAARPTSAARRGWVCVRPPALAKRR